MDMISLCTYHEEHMMAPNLFQLDRYELYLMKIDLFGTSYSSFHSNFENRIPWPPPPSSRPFLPLIGNEFVGEFS